MRKSNALMYVVAPFYVLYPQARDRCMPPAAMPTRKVREASFPRVNSATALSVILFSSFIIIKSQVLRLESCCPGTSAFFSLPHLPRPSSRRSSSHYAEAVFCEPHH